MEKEQAIEVLKPLVNSFVDYANITMKEEDDDIVEALEMAVESLKAQLSSEDATSDMISKTETVEHLRRVLGATVPVTDYDEGFVDGVEFGVSTVSTMPTIQPETPCYLGSPCEYQNPDVVITQPERPKGEWIDYAEDGYVECPFCHSATNCDGNKDELHFCFSCGADLRGEQDG